MVPISFKGQTARTVDIDRQVKKSNFCTFRKKSLTNPTTCIN